jgi:hypothetical protein
MANLDAAAARARGRFAERERARAIDEALAPIGVALTEAMALGRAEHMGPELMRRVAAVWHWADCDEHVERYAVEQVTPIAWNLYQEEGGWHQLRQLLAPLEPLVDQLAVRIQRDPSRIAYAAPCAQMFVFRAELAASGEEQRRLAETAVAVCPSHSNGRLVLAGILCHEVRACLDRGFVLAAQRGELRATVERAAELYPASKSVDELRQRIEALQGWV